MSGINHDELLNKSTAQIEDLLTRANKQKKVLEKNKNLTGEDKVNYDLLIKYIQSLNIILVHKQQKMNLSLEPLSNEVSLAIDVIINSPYNKSR
ncbi:MAG: hypothetical protein E7184_01660 [Erysipelotrichaceae bacterium]|nr:hypothetical protein [Erysipelotrichaceae bacterium]